MSAPYQIGPGLQRFSWFGFDGTPSVMFDGTSPVVGGIAGGSMYSTYQPIVQDHLGQASPLTIAAQYAIVGTSGSVNAHIEVSAPVTTTNNWVHFVVIEHPLHAQVNLARAALADEAFPLTSPGQSVDITRVFTLDPSWVADNIGVIVFVETHSGNKAVLQAARGIPDYKATVAVDATPDGLEAPWHLEGPDGFSVDGTGDRTLRVFSTGAYALTWQPVVGWTLPVPATSEQTVAEDGTITFAGAYTGGPFTVVTAGPLGATGPGRGVSFADYDGDGDPDLLVTQHNAPCRLLRNDGAGAFTDVTAGLFATAAPTVASVWADFDNDGDLDVYQTLDGQPNRLLRNDGGGVFTDVAAMSLVADAGAGRGAGWADYDRDGKLDLCLVNDGQDNVLYHAIGDPGIGRWLLLGSAYGGGDAGHDGALAWADYDNDGDPDYFLAYRPGADRLMQNQGTYGFWDVAGTGPLADTGNGMGGAWGDFDNNGWPDLYLANDGNPDALLRNDGGMFSLVTGAPLGDVGRSVGAAWGDWDNDGDLDLYVSRCGQWDMMLRNEGGGDFTRIPIGLPPTGGNGQGVAWADVDGDGDLDLYLANDGDPSALLRNDNSGNGNHWLEIDLVGVTANRSAIGARVIAVTGAVRQLREIATATGYYSQNALTAHFGLGLAASVDTLEIRWPGGGVQTFRHVVADQRLTIRQDQSTGIEQPGEPGPTAGTPPAFALLPARPNPFNPATTIAFTLPSARAVRLAVYDAAGRLVRTLVDGLRPAGRNELRWDGRNDAGAQVGSGTYYCRFEAGSIRGTTRLTLVK